MENETQYKRVLPFVVSRVDVKKGKEHVVKKDNLTNEEIRNMSCESIMLQPDEAYEAYRKVNPLVFNGFGTGIRMFLCYDYDMLTKEEQDKYFDRTIVIPFVDSKEKDEHKEDVASKESRTGMFSKKRTRKK